MTHRLIEAIPSVTVETLILTSNRPDMVYGHCPVFRVDYCGIACLDEAELSATISSPSTLFPLAILYNLVQ